MLDMYSKASSIAHLPHGLAGQDNRLSISPEVQVPRDQPLWSFLAERRENVVHGVARICGRRGRSLDRHRGERGGDECVRGRRSTSLGMAVDTKAGTPVTSPTAKPVSDFCRARPGMLLMGGKAMRLDARGNSDVIPFFKLDIYATTPQPWRQGGDHLLVEIFLQYRVKSVIAETC